MLKCSLYAQGQVMSTGWLTLDIGQPMQKIKLVFMKESDMIWEIYNYIWMMICTFLKVKLCFNNQYCDRFMSVSLIFRKGAICTYLGTLRDKQINSEKDFVPGILEPWCRISTDGHSKMDQEGKFRGEEFQNHHTDQICSYFQH